MPTKQREKMAERQKALDRFTLVYNQLNPGQKLAVDSLEGPVMVMAGPGTGKTQVLAMRIANILKTTQMDPWNILCLTFTESGVTAMRERLLSIIGTPAYYVKIHTFHSFCNEIIQDNPHIFSHLGSQVVSDVERLMILRAIIDKLSARSPLKPFGKPYLFFKDIAGNIQSLKREDISPADFLEILQRLQIFCDEAKKDIEYFMALAPKERTQSSCEQAHEQVVKAGKKAKLPEAMSALVEHMFLEFQTASGEALDARSAGKARTQYKNRVKKWWQKITDHLPKQVVLAQVYEQYQTALGKQNRFDYEDMIMNVVIELKKNDRLLGKCQEQFQYVLVDEYQDTNGAQNDVVDLLGSFDDVPNIFVVGDDKQSIYRFQGASLANMLHFYNRYKKHVAVISLRENYRSTQPILDAAGQVITHNRESLARYVSGVQTELLAMSKRVPEQPTAHVFLSEDEEDYFITTQAKVLLASGVPASEIAVLYRNHKDGVSLHQTMQRLGVPARLENGENVLDDPAVKAWLKLMTFLVDGRDQENLADILQFDWWHLPAVDTLKIIHYAGARYRSLFAVLVDENALQKAEVKQPQLFIAFAQKLAEWHKASVNMPVQLFLEMLLVESRWLEHVMDNDEQASVLRKVTTLLDEAKKLNLAHHQFTLADFLQHIQLLFEHEVPLLTQAWQSKKSAVRLMTAHKAKGLEFEHVFIARLNDKHWGNVRDVAKAPLPEGMVKYDVVAGNENNEDERRLFYVALTRAKRRIYLTRATFSSTGKPTVPAIFLSELQLENAGVSAVQETDEQALRRLQTRYLSPLVKTVQSDVKEYVASLLDEYVMSVTHLNNYLDCPRKFYFRNLLKIPSVKTKNLALGSAVHGALYELFSVYNDTKTLPDQAFLLAQFEQAMSQELLSQIDMADALEQGRHILTEYYEHYKDAFSADTLLEYNFASHGVRLGDLQLTGKIDKIEIVNQAQKTINVVDYKTGNVDNGLKKFNPDGEYYRQLVFYQLLCNESPRFPYTMASGELDFIEPSKTKGFIKKKITVSQAEVENLKKTIERVWQEIKALKFLDTQAGCGQKECQYCTN